MKDGAIARAAPGCRRVPGEASRLPSRLPPSGCTSRQAATGSGRLRGDSSSPGPQPSPPTQTRPGAATRRRTARSGAGTAQGGQRSAPRPRRRRTACPGGAGRALLPLERLDDLRSNEAGPCGAGIHRQDAAITTAGYRASMRPAPRGTGFPGPRAGGRASPPRRRPGPGPHPFDFPPAPVPLQSRAGAGLSLRSIQEGAPLCGAARLQPRPCGRLYGPLHAVRSARGHTTRMRRGRPWTPRGGRPAPVRPDPWGGDVRQPRCRVPTSESTRRLRPPGPRRPGLKAGASGQHGRRPPTTRGAPRSSPLAIQCLHPTPPIGGFPPVRRKWALPEVPEMVPRAPP